MTWGVWGSLAKEISKEYSKMAVTSYLGSLGIVKFAYVISKLLLDYLLNFSFEKSEPRLLKKLVVLGTNM